MRLIYLLSWNTFLQHGGDKVCGDSNLEPTTYPSSIINLGTVEKIKLIPLCECCLTFLWVHRERERERTEWDLSSYLRKLWIHRAPTGYIVLLREELEIIGIWTCDLGVGLRGPCQCPLRAFSILCILPPT